MRLPVPGAIPVEFRAVGHIPLKQGWKVVYGIAGPEPEKPKEGDAEAEQMLPQLVDGEPATLTRPRVDAKKTQPPPRYNEGTLVDAMQNAWRFVTDDTLRERLKEAKGIGTPATRAEIIKGLKRQNLLTVDPGMTAVWEMRLDEIITGRAHFKGVIDEIAAEAAKLIQVLCRHTGALLDLNRTAATVTRRARGEVETKRNRGRVAMEISGSTRLKAKSLRTRKTKAATPKRRVARASAVPSSSPTARMVTFAEKLAKEKRVSLPADYAKDFEICRRFLDEHAQR
jgi:DNA topoisomerase-3